MFSKIKVGEEIRLKGRNLLVQSELGSGYFGTVYKVVDTRRQTYALKQVICEDQESVNLTEREIEMLRKADHERIVRILEYQSRFLANNDVSFLILTEFCSGGDLNSRLNKSSSDEINRKWMLQLSEALRYLHSRNPPIVHRDLKADNVLLTDESTQNLKLGDFGLAREYMNNSESTQPYYMKSGLGPLHWMAPEFFRKHYTEKADVFSLGGIFYAILTCDFIEIGSKKMYGVFAAYKRHGKVGLGFAMAEIDSSVVVKFPLAFQGTRSMRELIESMLSYSPASRPSAGEVEESVRRICSSMDLNSDSAPSQQSTCC